MRCMFVCFVRLFAVRFDVSFVRPFDRPFVRLSACPSVCLSRLSGLSRPSLPSVIPSVRLSRLSRPSVCPFVCPSVRLFVCPPVRVRILFSGNGLCVSAIFVCTCDTSQKLGSRACGAVGVRACGPARLSVAGREPGCPACRASQPGRFASFWFFRIFR